MDAQVVMRREVGVGWDGVSVTWAPWGAAFVGTPPF